MDYIWVVLNEGVDLLIRTCCFVFGLGSQDPALGTEIHESGTAIPAPFSRESPDSTRALLALLRAGST